MKLVIFGANGPTGQPLTSQALAEGHAVTAVTRHPELFSLRHERLQVLGGDVFDSQLVEKAVAGQAAVLSSLGVPFAFKPISVYSHGMTNIMQAMRQFGVRRLVCVTSSAANAATRYHDSGGGFFVEKIMKPVIINTIGRSMYADMDRMEKLVMASPLDWTIIRPSGLFATPTVTDYQVAETFIRGMFTSRADLADCMLKQVTSPLNVRKIVAVATGSQQPSLMQFLRGETLQQRPS